MHNIFRMHPVLDSYIAKYYNCYCNPHLLRNMFSIKRTLQLNVLQMVTIENKWLQLFGLHAIRPARLFAETKYFARKRDRTLNQTGQAFKTVDCVYCINIIITTGARVPAIIGYP